MVTRIIIDTNIFVSALGWEGTPRNAIQKAIDSSCELIVPREQLVELEEVMHRSHFMFSEEQRDFIRSIIALLDRVVSVVPRWKTKRGIVDDMLLDAAEQFAVDYLITGDVALLAEKRVGTARIVTPEVFLKMNR